MNRHLHWKGSTTTKMIQQTMTIDADEYNSLVTAVKAARANERVAFRAGAEATRAAYIEWARTHIIAWTSDGVKAVEYQDERELNRKALVNALADLPLPEMPE